MSAHKEEGSRMGYDADIHYTTATFGTMPVNAAQFHRLCRLIGVNHTVASRVYFRGYCIERVYGTRQDAARS